MFFYIDSVSAAYNYSFVPLIECLLVTFSTRSVHMPGGELILELNIHARRPFIHIIYHKLHKHTKLLWYVAKRIFVCVLVVDAKSWTKIEKRGREWRLRVKRCVLCVVCGSRCSLPDQFLRVEYPFCSLNKHFQRKLRFCVAHSNLLWPS